MNPSRKVFIGQLLEAAAAQQWPETYDEDWERTCIEPMLPGSCTPAGVAHRVWIQGRVATADPATCSVQLSDGTGQMACVADAPPPPVGTYCQAVGRLCMQGGALLMLLEVCAPLEEASAALDSAWTAEVVDFQTRFVYSH